jgi:hypothetical protein
MNLNDGILGLIHVSYAMANSKESILVLHVTLNIEHQTKNFNTMYVCMYKGWAFAALAPRPTVVYCA